MRKFFVISIPMLSLALFILIMLSGDFLKRPLGKEDNIPEAIETVIANIKDEKWEEAASNTERLSEVWKKVVRRVQFSSERDEINAFSMNMARLRGALMVKDKAEALADLQEAYEHWRELGR